MRVINLKIVLLNICVTFFLLSCEGIVGGSGKVISSSTREPLENVQIVLFLNDDSVQVNYTNEQGLFAMERLVGCIPKCPKGELEFRKSGY